MITKMLVLAMVALPSLLWPMAAAQATPIRADFNANFHPPNPCDAIDLGDLTGTALGGSFTLSYKFGRGGDLIRAAPPRSAASPAAAAARPASASTSISSAAPLRRSISPSRAAW